MAVLEGKSYGITAYWGESPSQAHYPQAIPPGLQKFPKPELTTLSKFCNVYDVLSSTSAGDKLQVS